MTSLTPTLPFLRSSLDMILRRNPYPRCIPSPFSVSVGLRDYSTEKEWSELEGGGRSLSVSRFLPYSLVVLLPLLTLLSDPP